MAKKLALHFKNMDAIINASEVELIQTDEIGEKIAWSVIDFFKHASNKAFLDSLRMAGLNMEIGKDSIPERLSSLLTGKSFVVSGTFTNFSRDDLKLLIEKHGGKNQSGISSKTDYLLAGEEAGPSKLEKAKKLKVALIDEIEFLKMINA